MVKFLKIAFCAAVIFSPLGVSAQTTPFALPEFLQGCDVEPMTNDCLDRAWKYADVVDDGFLSAAEVGRLARGISQHAKTAEDFVVGDNSVAKQISKIQKISSLGMSSQSSQMIIWDHDYDGDGKLSLAEFSGKFDATQEPALSHLIKMAKTFHKVFTMMEGGLKGTSIKEPGEGLIHDDITGHRDVRNGVDTLVVTGKVKNITQGVLDVPPLSVSLADADGKVVVTHTYKDIAPLGPNESAPFEVAFENPPATAKTLKLSFVGAVPKQ